MQRRRIVMIDILGRQYGSFRAGLLPDERLPPRWEEWRAERDREERHLRAAGISTARVAVSWSGFQDYVRIYPGPRTYSLLQIYANFLYRQARKSKHGASHGTVNGDAGAGATGAVQPAAAMPPSPGLPVIPDADADSPGAVPSAN